MAQNLQIPAVNKTEKKDRKPKVHRTREQKSILLIVSSIREDMLLLREAAKAGKLVPLSAVVALKNATIDINSCIEAIDKADQHKQ